ncbi:MAG: alpha/beta hydrolase [Gemmatimonadota bacterium]|nr:alpha/beta hydrolase [Gemmatimonadota bacterium]
MVIEGKGHTPVSGLLTEARSPTCLLVLGHGAGAPMTHPWMEAAAEALAAEGISTLRYNFQYAEAGRKRPDHLRRLLAVVASALRAGEECANGLPLFAGGKSMGGRMSSTLVAERARAAALVGADAIGRPLRSADEFRTDRHPNPARTMSAGTKGGDAECPAGLVFLGFPLHAPGRRESVRGDHLMHVPRPMLFHQGTRDRLADLELLRPLLERVGPHATLHVLEGGDHSLRMLKRLGRTQEDVLAEVARVTRSWVDTVLGTTPGSS